MRLALEEDTAANNSSFSTQTVIQWTWGQTTDGRGCILPWLKAREKKSGKIDKKCTQWCKIGRICPIQ